MTTRAYEVHLEVFEGPLDLLLYLIRKNDLDIENIPISQITQEYLAYLDLMKELNLSVVGDFLIMASTLMQIKARSLLPSQELPEDEGPDPRSELVAKLVEYQKFKEAASFLEKRGEEYADIFYRGAPRFPEHEKSLNIRIFDLLGALREVLGRAEGEGRIVTGEEYPIEEKISKILNLVEERPYVLLSDIFAGERARRALVTCVMALLELVKLQQVFARQDAPFGEIRIYRKEEPPEEVLPVWPDDSGAGTDPQAPTEAGGERAPE
ncbi:MAG: segregation/condensation protein A [Elusimicrobiota bacterium]